MISVELPKVTLGDVRLRTIALGAKRGEQKPKPPQQGNCLLMEGGYYMLYEDGSRVLLENGGGSMKPYDKEVKYLEFTGNQWIDLWIYGNLNTEYDIKFEINLQPRGMIIFGVRTSATSKNICTIIPFTNDSLNVDFGNYQITRLSHDLTSNGKFRVINSKDNREIYSINDDDTETLLASNTNAFSTDFSTDSTIKVGYLDNNLNFGGINSNFVGKFYSAIVKEGDETILDLIPVRKGDIGYMYNKIDGKLYGNDGSGEFILGKDL